MMLELSCLTIGRDKLESFDCWWNRASNKQILQGKVETRANTTDITPAMKFAESRICDPTFASELRTSAASNIAVSSSSAQIEFQGQKQLPLELYQHQKQLALGSIPPSNFRGVRLGVLAVLKWMQVLEFPVRFRFTETSSRLDLKDTGSEARRYPQPRRSFEP